MLGYVQGRNRNCGCHDWLLFYEDFGRTGASSDPSTGRCVPATAQHSIALIAPVLFSSAVRAGLSSSSAASYARVCPMLIRASLCGHSSVPSRFTQC
jgi:hypothetical protein